MATFCISSIEPSLKQRILQEAGLPEMSDRNLGNLIGKAAIKLGISKQLYEKYIDLIIPEISIKTPSPSLRGDMTYSYGNQKRTEVSSSTTIDAIKNGERTATTRFAKHGHLDYWKAAKVGDIIEFKGKDGSTVLVRVTKPLTKLSKNTSAETWSKKEGWSVDYYNKEVKPEAEKGEAYQLEYELVQQSQKKDSKEYTERLRQAQLESKEKAWQELKDSLSRKVKKSKNFKKDHTYYVEKDGKKVKVEKSITTLNRELHGEKEYDGPNTPAAKIGNTFDAFIRDYFSEEGLKKSYPNLSDSQYKALKRQVETILIPQFNKKFGKGNYKILTKFKEKDGNDELTVAGTISMGGTDVLTAGTVDMIVVTNDGWYLYDMKTTRKGINGTTESKYRGQVTAYKNFIVRETKESGIDLGEFKGYGLVVANTSYPTDNGYYDKYNNLDDSTTEQVLYDGKPIQEAAGYSLNIVPIMDIQQDDIMGNLAYSAIANSDNMEEAEDKIIEEEEKAVKAPPVKFIESKGGYPIRRKENADWSDVTISFAEDFSTWGELGTKKDAGKKFVASSLKKSNLDTAELDANLILQDIKKKGLPTKNIKLNIAGNGIYSLSISQEDLNNYITEVIRNLQKQGVTISEIRSGGQTGADEAGIIAAIRLGIKATVVAPKDFEYRDINHKNIKDKESFIARFTQEEVQQEEQEESDTEEKATQTEKNIEQQIEDYGKDTLRPISAREELIIGRNAMKMAIYFANKIASDPNGNWKKKIFGTKGTLIGLDVDAIIRQEGALKTILNFIKEESFGDINDITDDLTPEKAQYIYDNWQAIINRGYNTLLRIARVGLNSNNSIEKTITEDDAMFEAFQIGERELNDNESYDIDKKEIDFQESIPTALKSKFYTIPKPLRDEDGVIIRREDGRSESSYQLNLVDFYDGEKVIQSIASLVHSCSTISQMISLMEQNQHKYPFFEQVLDILKDGDMQDKFFRTFRKNLTVYTTTSRRRGRMTQQTLNKAAKKDYIMQSLRSRLLSVNPETTPSMFRRDKNAPMGVVSINKEALASMIRVAPGSKDRSKLISAINSSSTGVKNLIRVLNSIGIDTVDDPSALIGETTKVEKIKAALEGVYKALNRIEGKISLLENTEAMKAYSSLASTLLDAVGDRANATQYNAGKNYQTFTQPTFMQDTIEELAGKKYKTTVDGKAVVVSAQELLSNPESRYLRYRQFSYLNGKGERIWVNSWLEKLADEDGKASRLIRYWSGTTVNKKKLFKQSVRDYTLDTLAHYFNPDVFSEYNEGEIAAFRVPNYADKNADGYIVFEKELPRKGEKSYKDAITRRASEYFFYELQRMRAVIQQAADPNLASKDVANFHLHRKKAAALIEKIQKGERITRADLVEKDAETGQIKLKDYIANSGLSFKFVSEINEALTNPKSKLGDAIIALLNDKDYNRELTIKEAKTFSSEFEKLFKSQMEANEAIGTATIKETLGDKGLKSLGLSKDADEELAEFFWQNWLAANNIYNLMVGDLAYYKDVTDVQKRFAEVNAGTEKPNTESTFTTPTSSTPREITDKKMRVVVVKTETLTGDTISARVKEVLKNRVKELYKKNKKAAIKLDSQIDDIVKGFKNIDATDGQGFATPTGFWKKMKMLGEMNPEFARAFDRVRKGDFSLGDIDLCVETLKPFGYGFVEKEGSTILGDELVPFQIKDSEAMLFLAGAILREGGENGGPLAAIYEAVEASHYSDKKHTLDTYVPNGIDVIVFDSGVKSGNYGIVDLNGLSYNEIVERLKNLSTDEIKEFPFENWGKQQNTPAHMQDHKQAMSSQGRIIAITDFLDDDTIAGRPAKQVIKEYLKLIDEDTREGVEVALKKLGCYIDSDGNLVKGPNFNRNLARKVKAKAANDKRYSPEVVNALSIFLDDGSTVIPFGDPALSKAVMSTIFSAFKNNVNKEAMLGGPAVLTTGYGLELKIDGLDDSLGQGIDEKGIYYEAVIVPPTKEIERKVTYNARVAKEKKYKLKGNYKNGDILSMEDIDANHILREEEKEYLLTFIPCEDKYSMVRCKIKEFMPRFAGEVQRVSKAITAITGKDFDIDKGYNEFFFDTDKLKKDIKSLKDKAKKEKNPKQKHKFEKQIEKKERDLVTQERKNKILRIKMDALSSPQAIEKLVSTGEYKELEDLAVEVDPTFENGLGSLAIFTNAMAMHRRNAAGKESVGIAALNNVSHGIANLANIAFKKPDWAFSINGNNVTELFEGERFRVDPTYNMEGARISGILRQFVGAAADNGKKPILGSLNTNPITANMYMGMLRMGFPLKTVVYMLNNPIIKEITRIAEVEGGRFEQHLAEFASKYLGGFTNSAFNKTDFKDSELLERTKSPFSEESITDVDRSVLYFFMTMAPYCLAISDLNQFTSLNSLQNAAGPTEFDERVKYYKMAEIIERSMLSDSLWEKDTFMNEDGSYGKLFTEIPFLQPLYEIYEKYIPDIAKDISPVYSEQFGAIMDMMREYGLDFSSIDMDFVKTMRGVVDAFEVYRSTSTFLKSDPKTRKERLFDFPIKLNEKKSTGLRNTAFMQAINIGAASRVASFVAAFSDVAMLTQEEREEVTASSADLMKSPANWKFIQQVAEYMFNRFGFSWKPKSTANLFSNDIKAFFKNAYREVFMPTTADPYTTLNFVIQFARNNTDSFLWKTLKSEDDADLYKIKGKTLTLTHDVPILGIKLDDQLYLLDLEQSTKKGENIYVEAERLGVPNQFMEYNAEEGGTAMKTVVTEKNLAAQEEKARVSEAALEQLAEENDDYDGEEEEINDTSASEFINNGPRRLSSQEAFTARDAVIQAIEENDKATELLSKEGETVSSFETTSTAKLTKLISIIEKSTSKKLTKVKELTENLKKYC